MKQATIALLIVFGMAALPAAAQKVTIDYAHDFDFTSVKTFQYVETKDKITSNELMDGRVKAAIIKELTEGGLTQTDTNPDLHVTYHYSSQDQTVYNTTNMGMGMGMGMGWGGWGGMGASTTTTSSFTEGTLVLDAYESTEKNMVWRGTGTVTVKAKPDKQAQQIDNILSKLGKKWDKILAGQGK
jgi:hypothetical protein